MLLLALAIGAYAVLITAVNNYQVSLVLFAVSAAAGLLFWRGASQLFLVLLALSVSFSARFRFGGAVFHPGAEASLAPLDFALAGLLVLWLIQVCTTKRKLVLRPTFLEKAMLLFVAAHVVSVAVAPDRGLALLEVARLVKMFLLVLVLKHYIKTRQQLALVIGVLFSAVLLQGVLAVSQALFGSSLGLGFLGERQEFWLLERGGAVFGRAGGTLGHANVLANFFEFLLPLALALYLSPLRGWLRWMALGALATGTVGLFLTFSRAGWGAILLGFAMVVLVTAALLPKERRRIWTAVLLGLPLVTVFLFFFWNQISQRLVLYGQSSWVVRIGTYQVAWRMIRENSLWGVGANNYLLVAETYLGAMPAVFARLPAHNTLLLILAEVGLLGLVTFLLLLGSILGHLRRHIQPYVYLVTPVTLGVVGGILTFLFHDMFQWLFRYDPVHTLFWFMVGILVAVDRMAPEEQGLAAGKETTTCQRGNRTP